jgi:hypothetical protein
MANFFSGCVIRKLSQWGLFHVVTSVNDNDDTIIIQPHRIFASGLWFGITALSASHSLLHSVFE